MWKKKKEEPAGQGSKEKLFKNPIKSMETTLISASVRLEGSIEAEGTLIVEGSVGGTIKCSSLEILENGRVEAKVEGENVTVAGDFEGEMTCSRKLSILRTGKVLGEISYGALSIESGGLLDGTLSRVKAEDTAILPFYKEDNQSQ
ncbi:MAG: polymer-forming cytoskeletal protein [Deltaproteobacteria bacterium]|nr:polymer-forming cytoskeletal protein [Deltaproteobacteria bacterium]MDH3775356.1 polymer-forming cytoskeletal protein [Deltaproteobacteria bacterium]